MIRLFSTLALLFLLSCKSTTYFIARHAEKEGTTMTSDPPLTAEGEKQALDLRNYLQQKNIKAVYSTNYARTLATAEPTRLQHGVTVKTYDPRRQDQFIAELKKISDGNVLVVGHSNTVDDVVNGLLGESKVTDLPDSEYGSLFIVKRKGNNVSLEKIKVPATAPR